MPNPILKEVPAIRSTEQNWYILVVDTDGNTGEFKRMEFATAAEVIAGTADHKFVKASELKSVVDTLIAAHLAGAPHTP